MPISFLTTKDGDSLSKSVEDINKKLSIFDEVLNNITQQYHQFAITFQTVKPLFETLLTDTNTVDQMKKDIEYYESDEYKIKILKKYELNPIDKIITKNSTVNNINRKKKKK